MCAIFGFISTAGAPIDLKAVAKIVDGNIARGPHAYGFAWIDDRGILHAYRQQGRLSDHLGALAMARRARLLVGHLRWATHGHPENNINNHPHPCDGGWLVHNGIVTNYESLCRRHQLWPVSECDSEALTLLIEQRTGTRLSRSVAAVEQSAGRCATLGLWSRPDTLVAVRRGNPLYASRAHGGIYMASCSDGLPGFAKSLPDCSAVSYRVTAGGVVETARKLKGADTIAAATGSLYCGG